MNMLRSREARVVSCHELFRLSFPHRGAGIDFGSKPYFTFSYSLTKYNLRTVFQDAWWSSSGQVKELVVSQEVDLKNVAVFNRPSNPVT
jgi:hypothetical protein